MLYWCRTRISTESFSVIALYPLSWLIVSSYRFSCHCYADNIQLIPLLPETLIFLQGFQHIWQTSHHRCQLICWNQILVKLSCCTSLEMHPHVRIEWSTWTTTTFHHLSLHSTLGQPQTISCLSRFASLNWLDSCFSDINRSIQLFLSTKKHSAFSFLETFDQI